MDGVRLIVITVPPRHVQAEISDLRATFSGISSSHAAAAYPPHVTLRTGVMVPEPELKSFVADFGRSFVGFKPFEIHTAELVTTHIVRDGVEVPIVALEIVPSAALVSLNARLLQYEPYRASDRTRFWPHLTLAFQDLSREGRHRLEAYLAAREELRSRRFAWTCDNVSLYRQQGRRWRPYHVYRLT